MGHSGFVEEISVPLSLFYPLNYGFLSPKCFLLKAMFLPSFLQRVSQFLPLHNEALCDVDLIDILELLLSLSFGFEDISKFLFVPSFKMGFDMFKFLLEHVHFCALNIQSSPHHLSGVISEIRV